MGFVTLFHNFANWTDTIIVCIPTSFTSKRIWKAFWLLVLLVTTICFSLQAYLLIRDYLNYDKSTVIRLTYAESLPFPAVTICNLNPYKRSKVNNSQSLQNLITAYNYVTGKKIQQAQNNITSTRTTIEPTTQEMHIRKKRSPCVAGTFNSTVIPPGYSQPQVYSVFCPSGGPTLQFTTCNGSGAIVTSRSIPVANWNSTMQTQMEQAFYLCLMPAWCSGGCGSWPNALNILTGMTKCIQDNNISSPYPTSGSPTQAIPTFANAVAEGMADNCSLLNSSCNLWIFTKPNNPKYPGNWWSQECGVNNPYIFGCDSCSGGTYNYTGTLNGCANYTATLAARVVQAENDSLCGTSSTACNGNGTCPYSYTTGCGGSEYQNFTCSILNCNQTSTTTTTIMHTTTGFDTTTELTTKDASTTDQTSTILSSTLATTTVAPTTTIIPATTTMELTTTPPTTTLSSTTTIAATTATPTTSIMISTTIATILASTTTVIPTTTLSTTTASSTSAISSSTSTASSLSTSTPTASSSSTSTSIASTSTSSSTTTQTTTSNASTSALSSSTSTSATSITSATVASSTTSSTATTVSSSSSSTPLSTTTSTTSTLSSISTSATSTTSTSTIASSTRVLSISTTQTAQTSSTTTNGATATSTSKPTTPVVSSTYQSPVTTNSLATFTAHTTITSPTTLTATTTPTTTPLKNTVSSSSSTTISSTNQSTDATALSSTTMPLAVAATSESTTTTATKNLALSSSAATISPQSTSTGLGVTTASINTKQVFSTQVSPSSNTNLTWTNSSPIAEINPTTSKVFIISTNTTSLSSLTPLGSTASWSTTPITFNSSNLISSSIASLGTTMINNHGLTNVITTSRINVPNYSGTPSTTSQYVANSGISSTDSEAGISSPNPNDLLTFNSGSTKISTSDVTESLDSRRPNTRNDLLTTNLAVVTNIGNDVSSRTTTMSGQDQELTTDSENSVQPKTNSDLYTEADKFGKITSRDSYFSNQQRSTRMFDPYSTLARNTANGFDNTSLGQERDVTTMSSNKNSANSNGSPISSQTTTNNNSNGKTAHSSFDPEDGLFTFTHPQTRSNENDRTTTNIFENASSTNENGKSQFGMLTTSQNTQELAHSNNSSDFVTSSPRFPNNQTFSGSTNFSRNMNSSFTSSTPIFFEWSTSSFSKNVNTSINTSSTYGIGVTVNSNQNQTNQGSTLFPITTTSATNYSLTNLDFAITCPLCFNISNLTQTQTAQLDQLSSLYGLDPDSSQVTIDANFQEALNYVSASMPESEREECGYSLTDLVQSCVIAGNPCNLAEDFALTFDVDYGNCYTFNYQYPDIKYNTTRSGAPNGLRMLVMSEVSDYLTSTSEAGIKITLHPQDCYPYPNVEGYKFGVGVMGGIYVSYNMYTRLDAPFGSCSSLDKLQELGQPFYFNGTYSTEGCVRSCFQEKLIANCSCADARIPLPSDTNVPFCSYLNETQEQCKTTYITENGDYYAVQGCQCDLPCEEQAYDAQLFESTWPDGGFLYEYHCTQYNTTKECQEFYSENAMKIEVSYARMGYQSSDETPVNDMFKLLNNMAGNLGLWIGISAITLAEFLLVFIQIWLWCCTKTKEMPDVPSLRYRNIEERSEREERTKMHDGHTQDAKKLESITNFKHASNNPENMLIYRHKMAPKNFENELRKRSSIPTSDRSSSAPAVHASPGYFDAPAKQDLYEEITPMSQYDSYLTTPKLVHESDLQHEPIP